MFLINCKLHWKGDHHDDGESKTQYEYVRAATRRVDGDDGANDYVFYGHTGYSDEKHDEDGDGHKPSYKTPTHPYIKQNSGSRLGELPKLASKTSLDSRTQDIAYATNCQTIKWTKQMGYKTI